MIDLQTVLFPTDDSPAAEAARPVAQTWARRHGATLHVLRVDVVPPTVVLRSGATPAGDIRTGDVVEARRQFPTPSGAITDYAREIEADLVVMGTHGRSGWDRFSLGSTAEAVLRQSPCPVVTVGADAVAEAAGPVLVPLAFESSSDLALETGGALAAERGTHIVALHVVEPVEIPVPYMMALPPVHEADIEERVRETVSQWTANYTASPVEIEIRHGNASLQIVNAAQEVGAGLIVQASHGRRGLSRWFLGSVAEYVVRHAACPVLTLRADALQIVRPDAGASLAVPRADWADLFDAFSRHASTSPYHVSVEVVSPAATGVVFREVPLIGLTYDPQSGELDVIADGSEHHVIRPFAIRSQAGAWALDVIQSEDAPGLWALDVVGADGTRERIVIQPVAEAVSA